MQTLPFLKICLSIIHSSRWKHTSAVHWYRSGQIRPSTVDTLVSGKVGDRNTHVQHTGTMPTIDIFMNRLPGCGGVEGTFLMEHMVTFRKFRFYHPPTTPSANEITKKYQGTFQNLPWRPPTPFFSNKKYPFTFQILLKTAEDRTKTSTIRLYLTVCIT